MGWWSDFWKDPLTFEPNCGDEAIFCARIFRHNGYDVRIAHGIRSGAPHVQAQAMVDGVWEFLRKGKYEVYVGRIDNDFEFKRVYDLEYFWLMWENG